MKKHKRLLIVLSIFFILATVILLVPKKGSYADFGGFSGISDYGSGSSDDSDAAGIFFIFIEILSLFVDLADLGILIIDNPQFSLPIIHLLLVIISLIKIHRKCNKDQKRKYMILSIFIPIITMIIFPKAKPDKYKPISTYVPQDSHITHITAKNEEKQANQDTENQNKDNSCQSSTDKNSPS